MKRIFSKEVLIGLLVILAIAVLVVGIDFLKGVNVFQKENTYHISYTSVEGLAVSAPVTVNGYKVGLVRDIAYEYDNPGHVRVDIDIDDNMHLPEGTLAILSSDLLGTANITLQLGEGAQYIKPGSELPGVVPSGMLDKVSNDLMQTISSIFPKVDTLLTTINGLVGDPAVRQSVERLDVLTANLVATTNRLNAVVATLPPITTDIKDITGNFVQTSNNINKLTGEINDLPIDSIVGALNGTIQNLQDLTQQLKQDLNNPESTLGRLMNDPALYENLNNTVQSLDSLFIDIKKNPKRYINIKLL